MAKIKGVTVDYDDGMPIFRVSVIITLDSDQTIFLSLESKANDPAYTALLKDGRLMHPRTDGHCIYWPDGPCLSFEDIMEILRT